MARKPTREETAVRRKDMEHGNGARQRSESKDRSKSRSTKATVRQSENWYQSLFNAATDALLVIDRGGRIVEGNQQASSLYGYSPDEFRLLALRDLMHPGSLDTLDHRLAQLRLGGLLETELVNTRKDRSPLCVEVRAISFAHQEETYVLASIREVTGRKRAEEEQRRLQTHMQQAQKMEALGTLAGGIAHDFNNLLTGIQGSISLMRLDISTHHPHYQYLKGMEDIVKRGVNLTKQLLSFARGGTYEVRPTDLNHLVSRTAEMFGRTRKEITLHEEYRENLRSAEVDRGQIEQVLLNLLVNSWQAMPEGGDIVVRTENVAVDGNIAQSCSVRPGNYVRISVTDNGVGMDEETMRCIFDPFFTTKETGKGTGLGLASAYSIIKSHGGLITVDSKKGNGSTFFIYLPASDKIVPKEKESSRMIARGTETILLVDDEEMILEIGKKMLNAMDYTVLAARGGKEALEIYQKKKDQIDVVVLDMIMPDMSGSEAFDRLKRINPDIKVVLASGYSLDGQASKIMERGCKGFIQKPFDMKRLSHKIREVVDTSNHA
nr:response regulator [Deltaproteobacteria bacterium]